MKINNSSNLFSFFFIEIKPRHPCFQPRSRNQINIRVSCRFQSDIRYSDYTLHYLVDIHNNCFQYESSISQYTFQWY